VSALPWFRVYHRMIDDKKLKLVAFEDRWHFVALCCLKCSGELDDPDFSLRRRQVAIALGLSGAELDEVIRRLQAVKLIDKEMHPVSWERLQQRSDSSAERVKRHRQARKDAGLQAQWQPSKALRQAIYDRDGGACVYCASTDDLTIDHKVPNKRGGDNSPENLQTACRVCNAKKRDLTPEEYEKRLAEQGLAGDVTGRNRYSNGLEEDKEKDKLEPKGSCASGDAPAFTVDDFVEAWNDTAKACGLSQIRKLTDARRRAFTVRRREYPEIADWQSAFRCLQSNKWMHGDNRNGWRADPDFFLQAKSFTKLVEGQYAQADR